MIIFWILISTFLISLISFVGILILVLREKLLEKILLILVAFSAGTLIGGAFIHLIPEAIFQIGTQEIAILKIFLYLLLGFCLFFVLENFINWHHHHHAKEHPEIYPALEQDKGGVMPFSYLILLADALHNFIDGIIIAVSFVIAFPLGLITTLMVVIHEIPQEIGDFGVLIYGGFKKGRALLLNFASAVFAIFGGIFGFLLSEKIGQSIVFLLPIAAGSFIYIACSDLIPEIKSKEGFKKSFSYFLIFLAGIGLMIILKLLGESENLPR